MYKYRKLLSLLFVLVSTLATAQEFRIAGSFINGVDQQPLPGATIKLSNARDTLQFKYTTSGQQGEFEFAKLKKGQYILEVSYIGFENFRKTVFAGGKSENVGKLELKPAAMNLEGVSINGTAVRAEQKGDTTQYNSSAFKVTQDATTEDLVKKMPGITIENGTVKAHGEDVKRILVDGKQFFGDDPSVTLKNLPAEVVDKIQVFDKLSDQAAWTGFDDGSGQKTINIVTKNAKNSGQFGKFSAGYGTDEKYLLGANVNFFKGQRRITLLGMSNNVNQQNFQADNVTGSGGGQQGMSGGRGGGGFQVGPQSGVFTTNAIGVNYTDVWGKKVTLNASYFWNNGLSTTNKLTDRQYILGGDVSQFYGESSKSTSENTNHRINLRLEYNIDTNNSIIFSPRFSLQDNNSQSNLNAKTATTSDYIDSTLINKSINANSSIASGYNFNNDFLYRHKFMKRGRTISLNLGTGITNRDRDSYVNTQSIYYQQLQGQINDSVDQYGKALTNGLSLSSNLVYTEPVGKNSQVQVNYNVNWSKNDNDKKTYNYASDRQDYTLFDTLLSSIYKNYYITHRVGTGYLYQTEKANLNAGITYQYASLDGNTSFPMEDSTHRNFNNWLPNLMFNYKFTKLTNLRVTYRASTNAPSISQLQKVIDNSNSLLLSTGNPSLNQEIRHFAMARFSTSNKDKTSNLFAMLFFQATQNYIGNASFRTANDTIIYGQEVKKGRQLTIPTNLNGAYNTRALVTIGIPIKPIKSNINFNTGVSYNRLPSLINALTNTSNTYGINLGAVLSSNISQKLDFTLTYNINYNLVENSIQPEMNNNYFFQIGSLQFNWEFWKGFFIQNTVTYQDYNLTSSNVDSRYTLWNVNFGKKIFKNKAGEIKLSCYDILNQNQSINRTVSDTYIEDTNTEVLKQYFMLSFTYNLRKFNGKMPTMQQPDQRGFDGRPDMHMH
jgi:hypothetical protein